MVSGNFMHYDLHVFQACTAIHVYLSPLNVFKTRSSQVMLFMFYFIVMHVLGSSASCKTMHCQLHFYFLEKGLHSYMLDTQQTIS